MSQLVTINECTAERLNCIQKVTVGICDNLIDKEQEKRVW
jgi:hypothetical protein